MTIDLPAALRIGIPVRLHGMGGDSVDPVMREAGRAFDEVVTLIRESGAEPVILEPGTDEGLRETFAACHGFVLPGGGDVDPLLFGGSADDPTLFGVDPAQDRLDLATIRYGVDNGLPVLGICRGMQLLNVAYGGSLHVDLSPSGVDHVMKGEGDTRDFAVHDVELEQETRVADVYDGADRIRVASFHHQGVDVLGDGLRITARAADGSAEAIEPTSDQWVLGIQWHPEADLPVAELRQPLFAALKTEAERALHSRPTPIPQNQDA